jgi:hypothetical protein
MEFWGVKKKHGVGKRNLLDKIVGWAYVNSLLLVYTTITPHIATNSHPQQYLDQTRSIFYTFMR